MCVIYRAYGFISDVRFFPTRSLRPPRMQIPEDIPVNKTKGRIATSLSTVMSCEPLSIHEAPNVTTTDDSPKPSISEVTVSAGLDALPEVSRCYEVSSTERSWNRWRISAIICSIVIAFWSYLFNSVNVVTQFGNRCR